MSLWSNLQVHIRKRYENKSEQSKFLGGEGVVDVEVGSSEMYLKWSGGGGGG